MIVVALIRAKIRRHAEIKRLLHGITAKMLTQQLREMEHDGLIERTVCPTGFRLRLNTGSRRLAKPYFLSSRQCMPGAHKPEKPPRARSALGRRGQSESHFRKSNGFDPLPITPDDPNRGRRKISNCTRIHLRIL